MSFRKPFLFFTCLVLTITLSAQLEKPAPNLYLSLGHFNNFNSSIQLGFGAINRGPYGFGYISLNSGIEFSNLTEPEKLFGKIGITNSYNLLHVGLSIKSNFNSQAIIAPSLGLSYYGLVDLCYERNFRITDDHTMGLSQNNINLNFRIFSGIIKFRKKAAENNTLKHWWW